MHVSVSVNRQRHVRHQLAERQQGHPHCAPALFLPLPLPLLSVSFNSNSFAAHTYLIAFLPLPPTLLLLPSLPPSTGHLKCLQRVHVALLLSLLLSKLTRSGYGKLLRRNLRTAFTFLPKGHCESTSGRLPRLIVRLRRWRRGARGQHNHRWRIGPDFVTKVRHFETSNGCVCPHCTAYRVWYDM